MDGFRRNKRSEDELSQILRYNYKKCFHVYKGASFLSIVV